ncbi:MAG: hypothetical protein QHH24_06630 [Candidatus Bathyarchaeota archaeon]|nr:hypothetical protein [Candidatus Bathyarchaeota archaeon]
MVSMPLKEQCGLCKRVFPYRRLRRCQRCGHLYCRDCMVEDVSTGDPMRPVCLNCARRVVAPRMVGMYEGLMRHLRFRGSFTNVVRLSFAQIDGIIQNNLPMEAYKNEAWWSNLSRNVHSKSWLDAGWNVKEVNLKKGYVVFIKVKTTQPMAYRKKRSSSQIEKPFTPAPTRPLRRKASSKTKLSKLYARIKNIERQRTLPKRRGGFKSKPSHEKRLFKPDEKPL